ncbi:MAG: beta-galactosidase [Chloroflexi bacterium]|nr:beta-galactosidase [Chloroflexota bacterium]
MQHTGVMARQRQLRSFVIAWLGVTLLMGALTFAGIYYATGVVGAEEDPGVAAVPNAEVDRVVPVDAAFDPAAIETTPAPRAAAPAANQAPASQGGSSALAQDATPVPTITPAGGGDVPAVAPETTAPVVRPVDDTSFQVAIQVQSNIDPEVYRLWMGEVRDKLKLNWIKQQVRWEDLEPEPGQYNWAELDVSLALAKEYGINVLLSVVTAPDWAREPGNQRLEEVGPPADPNTFANFLTVLLYRYPSQVHAIEVWNEMNIDREWASIYGLNAQKYVELLRTANLAIKAVDPGIIVISGALSPTGWNDGVAAYDDFVYFDMLVQAGLLDWADCVGAHHNGYNIGPNVPWNSVPNDPTAQFRGPFDNPHHSWSFYSTLNGYAQRIQQAGSTKKLCITEFGWPATEDLQGFPVGFEFANDNTLAEQAAYIDEAISLMNSWGFVWIASVWNLNYGPQAGWDASNDNVPYSLLRPEWKPAPAYDVIGAYNFRGQ